MLLLDEPVSNPNDDMSKLEVLNLVNCSMCVCLSDV